MYRASPYHPAAHTPWSLPQSTPRFPTSCLRDTPSRPPRPTARPTLPPHSTATTTIASSDRTSPKYSTAVPAWKELEPGVWSDGTDRVLSAAYPPVQQFLATARLRMSLPPAPSELVFTIAALEVFYSRNDPVHWMFWSDEKKNQTARVVNRIALSSPQLIRSKVAWNGIPEYLFILSGLHGANCLPTDQPWFHVLNPSKGPSPSTMNLRKRKAQQIVQSESIQTPEEEEGSELEEPRSKRSKTRSSRATKPRTPLTSDAKLDPTPSELSPCSTILSLPIDDKDTPAGASSTSAAPHAHASPSTPTPALAEAKSPCPKSASRQASSTPDPLLPRAASQSPMSEILTPLLSISHTRNRSTSQASSQTLVSPGERRSTSVLSNITAVCEEADTAKGEKAASDLDDAEDKSEDEEATGMVTRGRANKARTTVTQGKGRRSTKPRAKRRAAK